MKQKKSIIETPIIDKNYLNDIFQSIHQQFIVLDELNQQYKAKQQQHFVRSFMNVVEKMGNDLILAQQAYRNIDIEVKRDEYCMELATQLQFFRSSCYQLKAALQKLEKEFTSIKIEKENFETEIVSLHLSLQKKVKQNLHLKAINKQLQRKIKELSNLKESKALSYSIDTNKKIQEIRQIATGHTNRILITQGSKREQKSDFQYGKRFINSQAQSIEKLNNIQSIKSSVSPSVSFRRKNLQKASFTNTQI